MREIKKIRNLKYHKKGYMALELLVSGAFEMAPALKGTDTFDWQKKEMVWLSPEEKMLILNFISANEKRWNPQGKLQPLVHKESMVPKTIYISTQVYKEKYQLKITVMPPKDNADGRKALNMSLDWYQVIGFKLWLEESLRLDVRGRLEDVVEAYALYRKSTTEKEKVIRRLPKTLSQGDLYKWDDNTTVICSGRLYDPAHCIWTYCFKPNTPRQVQNNDNSNPQAMNSITEDQLNKITEYIGTNDTKREALINFARNFMKRKTITKLEEFSSEAAKLIIDNNKL